MRSSPDQSRLHAQMLARQGDLKGALAAMEQAVSTFPDNPQLANSAGDFAMKAGEGVRAVEHFSRAVRLAPANMEFAVNLAIALGVVGRHQQALDVLDQHRPQGESDPRYCSARANCARSLGDLAQAGEWYDRCLALTPGNPRALHGRARVAIERGDADAVVRFEAALAANRGDADVWLGYAEALDAAGDKARATDLAKQLVAQAPHWIAALRLLAQLRLANGEADFDSHFAEAARQRPDDPAIPRAHIDLLEQHDRFADALDIALAAETCFPDDDQFALMTATLAGFCDDMALARQRFDAMTAEDRARWLMEARFRLQSGEVDRAGELLDRLLAEYPDDISGWALRDLQWRLQGDQRAQWLHGQDGLVQRIALPDGEAVLAEAVPLLHRLHDNSAFPLGQSLRGGTQTRGILFHRKEPQLTRLHAALLEALEIYRRNLPPADDSHPLLRHRDARWAITGSWSVRLDGGGDHHASHLHPQGIISSALYCELPDEVTQGDSQAGWIELGRPPNKMPLPLEPLHTVQPAVGHLVLFPSTLYHGTIPFSEGRRMTVAFDVTRSTDSA